ncbi:hypothetical protein CYLTODRAFT_386107 [Cylindrobasidium torrendii FP15055 ss-10]|uniref:RING-type domain-containing protein n=1 Tax=Cylindrobasidium torrendii FP15055 ss-10 TaxID=1314674 RepID=A0A0D7BU78_9AGAR|nr:hypothetical protein CYLTODRAFT_386107 [Cylindrobasidium torrendii FP15055 ss-10]
MFATPVRAGPSVSSSSALHSRRSVDIPSPCYVQRTEKPMPPLSKTGLKPSPFGDCSICLYTMFRAQALFVAPCSHAFHYKCILPLVFGNDDFTCPNCRQQTILSDTGDANEEHDDCGQVMLAPIDDTEGQTSQLPL